ncbi:MAG: hypothetical protein D6694_14730 [Gammaproteobacteria bacterium]|nr:MAG: hypothetical protein D6694_14730 [Gammaproteobacteria bacterium]
MIDWLAGFLLPPGLSVMLGLCGVLCLRWRPWVAHGLLIISVLSGYLLSTEALAQRLMKLVVIPAPEFVGASAPEADLLVAVGAGDARVAPELGGEWALGPQTLNLLQILGQWQRQVEGQIAVIGRSRAQQSVQESVLMNQVLIEQFHLPVHNLLNDGEALAAQARQIEQLARQHPGKRMIVFCSAMESRRLATLLGKQNIRPIIVPVADTSQAPVGWKRYLPTGSGVQRARQALLEVWRRWML